MQHNAPQFVQRCLACRRYARIIRKPSEELNPITSPWSFAQWGLDLVRPLPQAPRNMKWLIIATNYFTKWIEVEPLASIRDTDIG